MTPSRSTRAAYRRQRSKAASCPRAFALVGALLLALRWPGAHTATPRSFIAVFGGTGLTGRETVYQALQQGHKVRVLARNESLMLTPYGSLGADAADLPLSDPKLKVIQGDVTNEKDVKKVLTKAVKGVVVLLDGNETNGTLKIVSAMKKVGAKRIVVVSQFGAGDTWIHSPMWQRNFLMWPTLREQFADKNGQEELFLNASGPGADLEFTILRPAALTEEPPTGVVDVVEEGAGAVARADLADFCLRAVLEKDFPHLGKALCLSSVHGTEWVHPWKPYMGYEDDEEDAGEDGGEAEE